MTPLVTDNQEVRFERMDKLRADMDDPSEPLQCKHCIHMPYNSWIADANHGGVWHGYCLENDDVYPIDDTHCCCTFKARP